MATTSAAVTWYYAAAWSPLGLEFVGRGASRASAARAARRYCPDQPRFLVGTAEELRRRWGREPVRYAFSCLGGAEHLERVTLPEER